MGYRLDDRRFQSRQGLGIFLFTTVSRPTLEPIQPPIQWRSGAVFLGAKRPGRKADHSLPTSAEAKECVELYLHSPVRLHGVVLSLKKHRNNSNFTFLRYGKVVKNDEYVRFRKEPITVYLKHYQ
jgi:hypothetical protein